MSSIASVGRRSSAFDFTDESFLSYRGSAYTSFETQRSGPMGGATTFSGDFFPPAQQPPIATKSIDLALAELGKSNIKRQGRKDEESIDLKLKPQNLPVDLPFYTIVIDSTKTICFYGREHFLSNYFIAPISVNGTVYRTVEHYYEACKLFSFGGAHWATQLNRVNDPGAVKVTAKRLMQMIDRRRVEAWKRSEGLAVAEHALTMKFSQHADLAEKLLETGDAFLAHCNPYDNLWATGLNAEKVKQWSTLNQGATLKIPCEITVKSLPHCPMVNAGFNALGYLLMQVRRSMKLKRDVQVASGEDVLSAMTSASSIAAAAAQTFGTSAAMVVTTTATTTATNVGVVGPVCSKAPGANKPIGKPLPQLQVQQSSAQTPVVGGGGGTGGGGSGDSSTNEASIQKLSEQLAQLNQKPAGGL